MNGKRTCSLLKSIRCEIAEQNGIEFSTPECTFQGECKGTCPKCEAELRYLAEELEKIRRSGKRVAVAGIAATMLATSAAGCARQPEEFEEFTIPSASAGEKEPESTGKFLGEVAVLDGDVAYPEQEPYDGSTLTGDVAYPGQEPYDGSTLTGDMAEPTEPEEEAEDPYGNESFTTTGVIAMPTIPEISVIAKMTEEEARSELVGLSFNYLKNDWQSCLILLDETEGYGDFGIGDVTIRVYGAEGERITDVTVTEEQGENADE